MEIPGLKTVRSDWSNVILVCRKCSTKLGGGFGPKRRTPLAKALRAEISAKKGRAEISKNGRVKISAKKGRKNPVGIVEVKCLGVCPRGAVTLVDSAAPDAWMLVPAGRDVAAVAAALGLARHSAGQRGGGGPACTVAARERQSEYSVTQRERETET